MSVTLTAGGTPPGADVFDVIPGDPSNTPTSTGATSVLELPSGTDFIDVYEGSSGTDGTYTLTFSTPLFP